MTIFSPLLEYFNLSLFQLINAPAGISVGMLELGIFFARDAVAFFPLVLILNWFFCNIETKKVVLHAILSMLMALAINVVIGSFWQHPRPFMMPYGHTFLDHSANNSFPSDHMSLVSAISFSLIVSGILCLQGMVLFVLSLMIAWGRIYLGVHFPLDMLASLMVAAISTTASQRCNKLVDKVFADLSAVYCVVRYRHKKG
ncbi:MAG: undecaprenyl pyrophosphate phosphatase [Sodalis sp. Ffu]|nr:MAG: undecaprenyl pyrophosphate phosphatase [Sodalis sp. Ffu]